MYNAKECRRKKKRKLEFYNIKLNYRNEVRWRKEGMKVQIEAIKLKDFIKRHILVDNEI